MNEALSETFIRCLEVERREDYQQTSQLVASSSPKVLAKNGLAIINLSIDNVRTSIGGKLVVELVNAQQSKKHQDDEPISIGDIKTGDIVQLDRYSADKKSKVNKLKNSSNRKDQKAAQEEETQIQGVVTSISPKKINIAIRIDQTTTRGSQVEEKVLQLYGSDVHLWIVQLSNEITYNRMESSMRKLAEMQPPDESSIVRQLLGEAQFVPGKSATIDKFYNDGLNSSQQDAIRFNCGTNDLGIIHGPPGTGKTSTIVELVKQLLTNRKSQKRILICGPSNISVDTILERLSPFFAGGDYDKLVRIGHPARILPQILKHSLDLIVERDSRDVVGGIMSDIDKLTRKLRKIKSYKERRETYQEIKDLKKELRSRTRKTFTEALVRAQVVVATLHGSSSREVVQAVNSAGELFDTLIIDEVSQALEPSCWIPIIYHKTVSKLIIAGDNKQLSPTIKTKNNKKVINTLSTTLFDRLLKVQKHSDQFICFLDTQYRMNEKIMRFPSDVLYEGKLVAAESVKDGIVKDLVGDGGGGGGLDDDDDDDLIEPIIWYDTEGGDFPEMDYDPGNALASSKYNEGECLVVLKHVNELLSKGVTQEDIGIITPYSAQVTKLRELFRTDNPLDRIEISTVDGFQGREKEIIILSLVRSNDDKKVGFLADYRRLNVSITRCKRQLCVVGDFETIGQSKVPFLSKWCKWCEDNDVDLRYVDYGELQ